MVNTILYAALGFMGLALMLTLVRFIKGKTAVDRVIALDVMTISSIGLIALTAHFAERAIYLDIALLYGLLSFIAVLILAKYIEKGL